MSTLRVNTIQNAAGSGDPSLNGTAKAWVNFNGTGTVAIGTSFNVTSISDLGTGQYQANITNAFANINYSVTAACGQRQIIVSPVSASVVDIVTRDSAGSLVDTAYVSIAAFR